MIRLATLNKLGGVGNNKHTDKIISVMQQEPVDILCCKKSYSPEIDQHAKVRDFAQALGMTYMFSSLANGNDSGQKSGRKSRTALAILTGKHSWMLNSGSLPLVEGKKDNRQAQFGVVRTNSNSLMVLNVLFQNDATCSPKKQLKRLLDHPMLYEQFGAVAMHSNILSLLPRREVEKIIDNREMVLHLPVQGTDADSSIMALTSKLTPLATISIGHSTTLPHKFGQITDVEMIRLPKEQRRKRYLPLSFRERWLGSRDGDRVFAF